MSKNPPPETAKPAPAPAKPAPAPKTPPRAKPITQILHARLSWKRTLLIMGLFLTLVILPVALLSSGMMERYQLWIDERPDTPFHRWLQLATADACYRTFRPEMAADYYRRFWERYPTDVRRPTAWLRYALSLEDSDRSADADSAFHKYLTDYPEREDCKEAAAGIERIHFVRH